MGLFGFGGCQHKWKKYGRRRKGIQQQKCSKCGTLRNKKVKACRRNAHRWKMDRRRKPPMFVCRNCPATRPIPEYPRGYEPEDSELESESANV